MHRKIVGLIDDDQIYQIITKKIAIAHSDVREVLQFFDGEEGISFFKQNAELTSKLPHLILLDINMPYLTGWQFLDELAYLQIKNYLPIIYIVTSSANEEDISKAKKYTELTGYHVKPVTKVNFDAFMIEVMAA